MGCQRSIAQQILDLQGSYVLALKDNQETLLADVELSFRAGQDDDFAGVSNDTVAIIEKGHGRIETRQARQSQSQRGDATLGAMEVAFQAEGLGVGQERWQAGKIGRQWRWGGGR